MFILDSLMIAGIRWALETTITAAEAEMNDDTALREQLLETELRREMGEISDEEFAAAEADLLGRIREIKERREGGSGPLGVAGAEPLETSEGSRFQVEAAVTGDFYGQPDAAERSERSDHSERSSRSSGSNGSKGSKGSNSSKGSQRLGGASADAVRATQRSRTPRTRPTSRTKRQ